MKNGIILSNGGDARTPRTPSGSATDCIRTVSLEPSLLADTMNVFSSY